MRFSREDFSGSYDAKCDVLYTCKKGKDYSYIIEKPEGFITFRSMQSDSVTGVIVYDFLKKLTGKEVDLSVLPEDVRSFIEEFAKKL